MSQTFGVFPIPVMKVDGALPGELVERCIETFRASAEYGNPKSDDLSHTDVVAPASLALYREVNDTVMPHLVEFGTYLFGAELGFSIKEIWANVLGQGGAQAIHTHANSFVSGIVYLTESDPSARTVFHRGFGGRDFIFNNENENADIGPFSGTKWMSPPCHPGDLILFPSYVPHEVPRNEGAERMTIAFNAVPNQLDTWGYSIQFSGMPAIE